MDRTHRRFVGLNPRTLTTASVTATLFILLFTNQRCMNIVWLNAAAISQLVDNRDLFYEIAYLLLLVAMWVFWKATSDTLNVILRVKQYFSER